MKTTELYFEYIVIGFETLIWMYLLFFSIVGKNMITILQYCIDNLLTIAIIMLCICFILGLITDRIIDKIFEKRKEKIKNKYSTNAKTSILIWEEHNNFSYAQFTLSRIRVLRSSILNSLIIGFLGSYITYKYYNNIELTIAICLLGILFSAASNIGHKNLLNNYYKKTYALEQCNTPTIIGV